MGLSFIFKKLALVAVTLTLTATSVAAQTQPGCESRCGNISIPYPFGTGDGCKISSDFFITCNTTFNPPKAFLDTSNIEILDISLDGYLRISQSIGYDCYNKVEPSYFATWMWFSKFSLSHTRNKFTAIGCDTYAYVKDYLGHTYSTGCLTFCDNITNVVEGSCSGIGCCQTAIPKGVRSYHVTFGSSNNHSKD
ncbi:wall-associated receptor kinase 2-like [Gossypium raimondii]|uniref:wall-associated receptor kinase 2-like n=1 Tax=Gossypium raimondii TaxID=29730 RepID=UPI00227A54E0|nr:wall-associated receptor kinase 2-like [Gossypium raimondii]